MNTIDNQQTSNTFTPATTLEEIADGVAGYLYVQNADVWCQLQTMLSPQGDPQWSIPLHVPQGGATLTGNKITGLLTGIRLWSYIQGTPALVSAAIFSENLPQLTLGSYGIA